MEATTRNLDLVQNIVTIFEEKNCTVEEAKEILSFTARIIERSSKAQCDKELLASYVL